MSGCIALRDDYDSIELRCLAKHSRDPRQVRRLLALAAVYGGMSRAEAANSPLISSPLIKWLFPALTPR